MVKTLQNKGFGDPRLRPQIEPKMGQPLLKRQGLGSYPLFQGYVAAAPARPEQGLRAPALAGGERAGLKASGAVGNRPLKGVRALSFISLGFRVLMGSEAEGPLFQAMELPTPRPPRYNSEIFIVSCVLYFFFLSVCGLFVWRFLFQKRVPRKHELLRLIFLSLPCQELAQLRSLAWLSFRTFLVEDTASSLRTLVTQREAQHAAVAASSDKVVSTLGAARTSCSSSRRRSAMRASCCCRLSGASGITAAPSTLGAARTSCSTRRPDRRRQCTFRARRCADNPQHSAARCLRLRPLALTIGHQRCTFDPWRCAGELQHSASLRGRQAHTLYPRPLALRG